MECPNCKEKINLKINLCPKCGTLLSKRKFKGKAKGASEQSDKSHKPKFGKYYASKESDKFHRPGCEWAQEIHDFNLIIYYSREDAIDAGRVPCHVCHP